MMRYISDKGNLKLIMTLLRTDSPALQYEAFHVFKVFVANPRKTEKVARLLCANRDKLVQFLNNFQTDRGALACATTPRASARSSPTRLRAMGWSACPAGPVR